MNARAERRWLSPLLVTAVPAAFLLLFVAYPLQGILGESFFREGVGVDDFRPLWADTFFLERAWFSFWQAAVSTLLTLALALPCAFVFARYEFPGKGLVTAIVTVPFVLPTIVVAVAFTALLGPRGLLNDIAVALPGVDRPPIRLMNTVWIILMAHAFYNFAVAARIIAAYWARLDTRIEEAAAVLGADRWTTWWTVTLPALRAPILAAASLVFLFSFTSFGVILILGGSSFGTIETEIYRETVFLFRLPVAASLAMLQIAFTLVVMATYTRLQQTIPAGFEQARPRRWSRGSVAFVSVTVAAMLLATMLPLGALVERSLRSDGGYTLEFYRSLDDNARGRILFISPWTAIRNSLAFAGATLLLALPIGVLAAYAGAAAGKARTWVEAAMLIPLGVSPITLGLGFIVTFDERPLNLRSSLILLVIAHTLVAYPFVARTVGAQLRGIDPRLREAARVLGAGPLTVFLRVDLPLLWRAIVAGAVFAFAISMGEFGATLLIARPEWATIPVAVFRYLGQPGSFPFGQALAMSTILMAVTAAGFVVLERLRIRGAAAGFG